MTDLNLDLTKLYMPQPKQVLFHACPADQVLYGGARGGGKSEALLWDAITQCLTFPGYVAVIFRRNYDNLMSIFRTRLFKVPTVLGLYNQTERAFKFSNESIIYLRAADEPKDAESYQGNEWDGLYIDEIQEFSQDMIMPLLMNLRGSGRVKTAPRFRASAWPWGIGHGWVRGYWISPAQPFEVWSPGVDDEDQPLPTRCFIPATIYDNMALLRRNRRYLQVLKSMPENEQRAAFGDWDVYEGQAFSEWRRELHVIKPFEISKTWIKRGGVDFGTAAPWAAYFYAEDPSVIDKDDPNLRRVYVFKEFYARNTDALIQAKQLRSFIVETPNTVAVMIPPDMNAPSPTQRGITPADVYRRLIAPLGTAVTVAARAGRNHRKHRKDLFHRFLGIAPDGKPWLQVFDTCRNLCRTIPELPIDPNRPDDVDTRAEDHPYDAITHALDVYAVKRIAGRDIPFVFR